MTGNKKYIYAMSNWAKLNWLNKLKLCVMHTYLCMMFNLTNHLILDHVEYNFMLIEKYNIIK